MVNSVVYPNLDTADPNIENADAARCAHRTRRSGAGRGAMSRTRARHGAPIARAGERSGARSEGGGVLKGGATAPVGAPLRASRAGLALRARWVPLFPSANVLAVLSAPVFADVACQRQ